jgi:hypothetical protein
MRSLSLSSLISGVFASQAVFAESAARPSSDAFPSVACWETEKGFALRLDNDLFAGSPHDSDYTGGFALDWTPSDQSPHSAPHHLHFGIDRLLGMEADHCRRHAWQFGTFALTPGTLRSPVPVLDDRPFATATLFSTTATWNGASENVAMQSTLQIGMLGLDVFKALHSGVHDIVGDERPLGYEFQISEGGEPTLRYALARHQLLRDGFARGETLQIKSTTSASVGFLTEATAGVSARWGRIDSPWQSFTPETAGYLPAPMPLVQQFGGRELFVFAGAQVRLRAYNALSQGQFRDSVHVLHASDLERWLGEAWLGVQWQPSQNWELTYTLRAQTPELRDNPARRSMIWAGLSMSRRF